MQQRAPRRRCWPRSRNRAARSAQGWMRLIWPAPATRPGSPIARRAMLGMLQRRYFEKQTRLWTGCSPRQQRARSPRRTPATGASPRRSGATTRTTTISAVLSARLELPRGAGRKRRARAAGEGAHALRRAAVDRRGAPGEFPRHQPEALGQALATQGESLTRGLANLLGDVQKSRISQSDEAASRSAATSRSARATVVFENELIQLIQYRRPPRRWRAPAGDGPALHQQVLHPRPAAREFAGRATRWRRAIPCSWSPGATSGAEQGHSPGTTTSRRAFSPALRRRAGDRRQRAGQRAGLLRRRHAARRGAAVLDQEDDHWVASADAPRYACSTSPTPGRSACSSTRPASPRARAAIGRGGIFPGPSSRSCSPACGPTTWSGRTWSTTT